MVATQPAPDAPLAGEGVTSDPLRDARATLLSIERRARGWCPITWRGALVGAFSAGALWLYAYGELDLVVFAVGIAGLVLVSIATLLTLVTTLALRRRLARTEARHERALRIGRFLEAGERLATGFTLELPRWLQLATASWSWLVPSHARCTLRDEEGRLGESFRPLRRCEATRIVRAFSVRDAFGLSSLQWDDAVPSAFRVLPRVGRLREVSLLPALSAADGTSHPAGEPEGDRMEIRRYVPGDSMRDILWKAYARSGQLNVRRPERSVTRQRRTVAYLVAAREDEAAAAAARVALESHVLGREWRFGADGTDGVCRELDLALAAIARSGSLEAGDQAAGLDAFLAGAAREGDTHCVVFVPGRDGPWRERALAAIRRRGVAPSFLVAVDRALPLLPPPRPLWRRWLVAEPAPVGVPRDEVDELARTLVASGAAVQVVERETGAVLLRQAEATGRAHLRLAGVPA